MVEWIKKTIKDKDIAIKVTRYDEPSKESPISGEAFETVKETIKKIFPEAIVTSYLMLEPPMRGKYQELSSNVYRFTPAQMDKTEIARMHGPNERMSTENISKAVQFFTELLNQW